ncbi:MAG: GNAT family N-acetyltransferase [Candidatus Kapabacteria bacterium]|nr:GNAT family N-acetyltransferase [Candidatus Kapabacteria bacterium]
MFSLVKYDKNIHFSAWQDFVRDNGHLYHDIRWLDIINFSYGLEPFYHLIYDSDKLIALAPFFKISNSKLLSLPFISFAGLCFHKDISENEVEKITEDLMLKTELGNYEIELRTMKGKINENSESEGHKKKYVTMIKNLEGDIDTVFKNFDKKQRNMIRKAEQEPFELVDCNLDTYYKIYLKATNDLGTPGHRKEFFGRIIENFRDSVRLKLLKRNKMEVGVLFEIDYFRTRYDMWAFSLKEFFQYKPNVFMYWETLKNAIETGIERYDFGRSTIAGGIYNFKKIYDEIVKYT